MKPETDPLSAEELRKGERLTTVGRPELSPRQPTAEGAARARAREAMTPGTSALFVLDDEGNVDVILHSLRRLRGRVLKTNVDVERARLVQVTLAGISES